MNINDIGKKNCSGCSLCVQLCVKECISMRSDEEGFLFPVIDMDKCIDCGLCYRKCPVNRQSVTNNKNFPKYYASAISDTKELLECSSGGTFIELAKYVLSQGGYVCGCVFDEHMRAVHKCTNSLEEVRRMRGSKYVQSSIEKAFPQVKDLIDDGKIVLFTGTACQIAAVKGFVKSTEKLFLVDILCHGVPSPLFFEKYVEFLGKKHKGRVVNLEFRNKKKLGWGSEHRTYYEVERNGVVRGYRPVLPAYFCSFFWGTNLRESCYNCKFAGPDRISDITIGDFWGYWSYYHRNFPEGISIASVNTPKGELLFDEVKDKMSFCDELPADKAKGTNTNFYHPTSRPLARDNFYVNIKKRRYEDFVWRVYLNKYTRKKILVSLYGRFMPKFMKKIANSLRY